MIEIIVAIVHLVFLAILIYKIIKFFQNRSLPSIRKKKSNVIDSKPASFTYETKSSKREPHNKFEELMNPTKSSLDTEKKMNMILERMNEELEKQNESKPPIFTPVQSTEEEKWKIIVKRLSEELEKQNESKLPASRKIEPPETIKKFKKNILSKYSLYHLSSIENLESILSEGILSHKLSMEKNPKRIADAGIVAYRNNKMLTSGYPLTYYANFYFQPKNPMLYRILKENTPNQENIIVFELKLNINSNDIFVSDGNCARKISQIETLPAQNIFLSIDKMMSKSSWNNENYWEFMAECLIPEKVEVSFIQTIHVQNEAVEHEIHNIIQEKFPTLRNIQIQKNPSMFFS